MTEGENQRKVLEFEEYSSCAAKIARYQAKKREEEASGKSKPIPEGKDAKPTPAVAEKDKKSVIEQMINNEFDYFKIERPFTKAQFHQCIPNPKRKGELITVQLVTMNIKQAPVNKSLDQMKDPTKLYVNYRLDGDL